MPNTYKVETYKEVLCWTADTKIQYRPNPKSGKSRIRYGKYEKAKTVGEAMILGSFPQDLFFDFEHGHITVKGGPKRKAPLDIKDQEKSWTRVDKMLAKMHRGWLTWKKTFQIADKLGIDRRQITTDKGQGESPEIRSKRLLSVQMAKLVLEEVNKTKRKISDNDVLSVLRLWGFRVNSSRQNVMREGQDFVYSDTLGLVTGRDGSVIVTAATTEYPEVTQVFTGWLRDHMPPEFKKHSFGFSSINVNCNYAAALHRDGNNEGPSMIKAFGKFTGGELNYWGDDDKKQGKVEDCCSPADKTSFDISSNLCLFDGNRGHSVEDFKGERFSLVFFCVGLYHKTNTAVKKELARCGIHVPTDSSMATAREMLGKPRGYKKRSRNSTGEDAPNKPTSCFWPVSKTRVGTDFTTAKMVEKAKKMALKEERPVQECSDKDFVGPKPPQYLLQPDGRRLVKFYVVGTSGGERLAAIGEEETPGTGRYMYSRAEGFECGPKLQETNQMRDVRQWLAKVVNRPDKTFGTKRCFRSKSAAQVGARLETPSRAGRKRELDATPTPAKRQRT